MNQIAKMIYLILQIGFTIIVTIFLCIGLGYLVEKYFGINLMVWFILLGVVSGFRAAYILIRKFVSFENPDDEYLKMIRGTNSESKAADTDEDEYENEDGERP